jgi:tRNA pseudouridine38-40 synthase
MRVIRLLVAYDGTSFHGWQSQPGLRTVQGVLTEALGSVLGATPSLHAAGRTDAGVHARGQVVSFASDSVLPVRAVAPRTNRELPADVRVREATEAGPEFHARFSARARRYAYRLLDREDVLLGRFAWWPRRAPNPLQLEAATEVLHGEHDFSSFRSAGGAAGSPRCHVIQASWSRWEGGMRLDIVADHFLYHMVRAIVGTVLEQATTADPVAAMRAILGARERSAAGTNAPPQGLTLEQAIYDQGDACAHP